jgi:ankyrin repeat protein
VNAAVPADGQTPLHGAALTGRAEVAKVLLEHGADKSKRDKSGKTALDIAAAQKDNPVADLLR